MKKLFLAMIALITGMIFFAGATTSFAAASKPKAYNKQKLKKPHTKKIKGVRKRTAGSRKSGMKKSGSSTRSY